jgi:hypothetical protein
MSGGGQHLFHSIEQFIPITQFTLSQTLCSGSTEGCTLKRARSPKDFMGMQGMKAYYLLKYKTISYLLLNPSYCCDSK